MATDLTGLSSIYTDYRQTYANNERLEKMKADWEEKNKGTEDEQLMDACKQFEAYFIEQMYKGMMKTIPTNENTSNYTATMMDYYKDQMVQSMAEESTAQGGFGLAQMLYEQMKRNYGVSEIPEGVE